MAQIGNILVRRAARHQRAWWSAVGFVLAVVCFGLLASAAHTTPYFDADLAFTRALQSFNPPWFDLLMRAVSQLGFDWKAITAISLITIFLVLKRLWWEAFMGLCASTGVWLLDNMVKDLVNRHRPTADLVRIIVHLDGPSFTSGHVTSFTVFYGFMLFLTFTRQKPSWQRTALSTILGTLILLVGISRIYSGEHWPSDVLGSYLLGGLWLAVIITIFLLGKQAFPALTRSKRLAVAKRVVRRAGRRANRAK
jgi:undecaprenyl-diphosphatase